MVRALSIFDKEVGGVDQKTDGGVAFLLPLPGVVKDQDPGSVRVCADPGMLSLQLGDLGM